MSSYRDKLSNIDTELQSLDEKQSELREQECSLNESRTLLIKNVIKEEKPFEGTKWELFLSANNNSIFFQYIEGNEEKIKEFRDLCFRSWHDFFELEDGITLRYDDGDLSLSSTEAKQLTDFAIKQNLIIIAKDIEDKVKRLSRQLAALQEICHQFNIKA